MHDDRVGLAVDSLLAGAVDGTVGAFADQVVEFFRQRDDVLVFVGFEELARQGVAAELHLAAVVPNMPYFEFPLAFPDSPVISDLLEPRLAVGEDGTIAVPWRPGLGFRLNEDVLRDYRVEPY